MNKFFSVLLSFILLFNTVLPSYASECNYQGMKKSAEHKDWSNSDCMINLFCAARKNKSAVSKDVAGKVFAAKELWRHGSSSLDKINAAYCLTFGNCSSRVRMYGKDGILEETKIYDNTELVKKFCKDDPCETPSALCSSSAKTGNALTSRVEQGLNAVKIPFDFIFGDGEGSTELTDKIIRLASLNKTDLARAIRLLAAGSDNPLESRYVHPLILQAAFMFYAEKADSSEKNNLTAYLSNKYPVRVRWSAANALATYADGNGNPLGKFTLTAGEKKKITQLFIDAVLALPADKREKSVIYAQAVAGLANLYADPLRDSGLLEAVRSEPQKAGFPLATILLAAPAAQLSAPAVAAGAAEAGIAFIGVGTLFFVMYSIDDAFSSPWRATLSQRQEAFVDRALTPTVPAVTEIYPLDEDFSEASVL